MTACLSASMTAAITADPVSSCTGFILLTGQEYQNLVTVSDLFSMPDPAALQGAFMAGLTLPMICFLTAWAYAQVINFIK